MSSAAPVWTVVLAAGAGTRFGGDKVGATVGGHSVLAWAMAAAAAVSDGVVVVGTPARNDGCPDGIGDPGSAQEPGHGPEVRTVAGADSRSGSVRAGLAAVDGGAARIAVHDAARPLASPALFRLVLGALDDDATGVAGVAPALPVRDALKRIAADGVARAVDRTELVAVQTPQAFDAAALRAAHAAGDDGYDDLELVERTGRRVAVVTGEPQAHKLTVPDDLVVLEARVVALSGWSDHERP